MRRTRARDRVGEAGPCRRQETDRHGATEASREPSTDDATVVDRPHVARPGRGQHDAVVAAQAGLRQPLGEHVDEAVVGSEGGAEHRGTGPLRDLAGEVDVHVVARGEQEGNDHGRMRVAESVEHGCHVGLLHVDERVLDHQPRRRTPHRVDQGGDGGTAVGGGRAVRRCDECGRARHPSSSTSIMPPTIRVR